MDEPPLVTCAVEGVPSLRVHTNPLHPRSPGAALIKMAERQAAALDLLWPERIDVHLVTDCWRILKTNSTR